MDETAARGVLYPLGANRLVMVCRFLNILDDAKNCLSPVKLNVWAANCAFVSTFVATLAVWLLGHVMDGVDALWGCAAAWLTQAHATHHFDKRERNLAATRLLAETKA